MKARASVQWMVVGLGMMLGCSGALAQQMYKWKDADGVVHYSDTAPPAKDKKVEVKDFSGATAQMTPAVPLPYALAQAVKNNPVTVYTTSDCTPCDQAKNALRDRGVPFSEKTVSNEADRARLAQAGGSSKVPFITIGARTLAGYGPGELQAALTAAAYPLTKRLPAGYQNPPAQSAAPAVVPVAKAVEVDNSRPDEMKRLTEPPPSPTGIRF
jgi:glutaredoxin